MSMFPWISKPKGLNKKGEKLWSSFCSTDCCNYLECKEKLYEFNNSFPTEYFLFGNDFNEFNKTIRKFEVLCSLMDGCEDFMDLDLTFMENMANVIMELKSEIQTLKDEIETLNDEIRNRFE